MSPPAYRQLAVRMPLEIRGGAAAAEDPHTSRLELQPARDRSSCAEAVEVTYVDWRAEVDVEARARLRLRLPVRTAPALRVLGEPVGALQTCAARSARHIRTRAITNSTGGDRDLRHARARHLGERVVHVREHVEDRPQVLLREGRGVST